MHQITSTQLMSFIISSQIGLGIITLPSTLAKKVGHDGWISVLLIGILVLGVTFLMTKLLDRFPDKSILDINIFLYGKAIGTLLNLMFIFYLLMSTGISSRIFSEIVSIIILKETPQLIAALVIMAPTFYFTAKGLKVICRFANLLYVGHILMIATFLLIIKYIRLTYLQPVLQTGFLKVLKSTPCTIYSFLGFELIAIFYPNVTNKAHTRKPLMLGSVYVTIYFVIITAFSILLFGEIKLKTLVFPIFNIEQAIRVPIIERLDLFFIMFWFPTMEASVRTYFFSSYYCLIKVFPIQRKKVFIAVVIGIVLIIGRIPRHFEDLSRYTDYNAMFAMINIGIMLLSFLVSFIKKEGENI